MQDELLRIVEKRLAADKADRQEWSLHVLAACEGEATLNDVLGVGAAAARQRTAFATPLAAHKPVGAYLKSIEVEGFRGVGPARRLELTPGPGLTLVVGRIWPRTSRRSAAMLTSRPASSPRPAWCTPSSPATPWCTAPGWGNRPSA